MMDDYKEYGPTLLRIVLAALFLYTGIGKLMNPAGPTGMLGGLGFPAPVFFAWILLLSEILFGIAVLLGWQLKYTVWPLVIILVVATIFVALPMGNWVNTLFHLLGIAALVSLFLTGPGAASIQKA